jgi:uncharacterized protein YegP (UPF0339 family)
LPPFCRTGTSRGFAPSIGGVTGYYQLIEGEDGTCMFTLRAGNHDTVLRSRVFWSREAALRGADALRQRALQPDAYVRKTLDDGRHWFEVLDEGGQMLARSAAYNSRSGLQAGLASVRRNGPSMAFRGLVRHASVMQLAQSDG